MKEFLVLFVSTVPFLTCLGNDALERNLPENLPEKIEVRLNMPQVVPVPETEREIARCITMGSFPFSEVTLTKESQKTFEKADVVVAVAITNVSTEAIFFRHEAKGLGEDKVYWHKVVCEVLSVVRGDFLPKTIEFLVCHDAHREYWPYVRGFSFLFGLSREEEGWVVREQQRTCPFPPYSFSDHSPFFFGECSASVPETDIIWAKEVVGRFIQRSSGLCLDVSIEKNEFVVLTFANNKFFGLSDYFDGVSICVLSLSTRKAVFPLPLFSRYESIDFEPPPMTVEEVEGILFQ